MEQGVTAPKSVAYPSHLSEGLRVAGVEVTSPVLFRDAFQLGARFGRHIEADDVYLHLYAFRDQSLGLRTRISAAGFDSVGDQYDVVVLLFKSGEVDRALLQL